MTQRKGLMDPKFRYIPAAETNIAATFARIRRQMKKEAEQPPANVKPIRRAK
jgi:hypothetical protein